MYALKIKIKIRHYTNYIVFSIKVNPTLSSFHTNALYHNNSNMKNIYITNTLHFFIQKLKELLYIIFGFPSIQTLINVFPA